MRKLVNIVLLTLIATVGFGQDKTFQLHEGDTINVVDANNRKQGHWIYFGNMKNLPEYAPEAKIEEGPYKTGRKAGGWKKYYPTGTLWSEITFSNNRPNGKYKTYYKNGQLQEEGVWKNNRNVAEFRRFHENGEKQQEFKFNKTGKREGKQVYYHENGETMIEGNWDGGKEDGEIKEYYDTGELKSVKVFNGGAIDGGKTKTYEPEKPITVKEVLPVEDKEKDAPIVITTLEMKNIGKFNGEGDHTLYNKNRQISKKGFFKKGKLWSGIWYKYDEDGILVSKEIYKDGKYRGEGVIDADDK